MNAPTITARDAPPRAIWALEQAGVPPLLARLFAARGVRSVDELDDGLGRLLAPQTLMGTQAAAEQLARAIQARERICVIADYDCDGATACAVALRGLRLLGAPAEMLSYIVPDRALHGYGLTPTIVDLAIQEEQPRWLLTVDNGIASLAGVAHARACGLGVIVTDHHLPALEDGRITLPDANVIVNPSQPDCGFESKNLAGVGVIFYVLLALRTTLRAQGVFDAASQPRLDTLLDLVALGTVADVVKLDANNRRLVSQGLRRIRSGRMQAGVAALFEVASRNPAQASGFDFGFALGPRINAAGRLADMTLGIECLLTDDPARAAELAQLLDSINRERRDVEAGMRDEAEAWLATVLEQTGADGSRQVPAALAIYRPDFHEGVVGIVASRLKERVHRPTFVFARGQDGLLKGSGRSIPGFHLRDALDLVSKRHPGVLKKFGGHAMAAGCTLGEDDFPTFEAAFAQVAREWLSPGALARQVLSDGPLAREHFTAATVQALDAVVWGQAFEAPMFSDEVEVVSQRLVGERHLKLSVKHAGVLCDAIWFGRSEPVPDRVTLAYRLSLNDYNGRQRVQMVIEAAV
ncbi:MAG: single-stranded-DNA-specific exonuclease RecJ [Pseudomonadota bacterium]